MIDRSTTTDPNRVDASPNKRFFVSMLTRDIELTDAILDLLDNCIDGVLRSIGPHSLEANSRPYEEFWAKLTLNPDRFVIEDNCGGIPREVARRYAFRMGRSESDSEDLPTIGMYGIGMKRAIFKMGRSSVVRSIYQGEGFEVEITPEWMERPDDWDLSMRPVEPINGLNGTRITVDHLLPEIASQFDPKGSTFTDNLRTKISQHYSIILQKGFRVFVNDREVKPSAFRLLTVDFSRIESSTDTALAPFFLNTAIDDVQVTIWAGIWRHLPSDDELDAELEGPSTPDNAGWTVICNDRIVVYRDRTHLTGWGDNGVPRYHGQFMGITGVAILSATDASKLPLTTTKRGIDLSSEVYVKVRRYMQEATRQFTVFANRWKKSAQERRELYMSATARTLDDLDAMASHLPTFTRDGVKKYSPRLPAPQEIGAVRIAFSRPRQHVEEVSRLYFEGPNASNSEVGQAAFDDAYARAMQLSREDNDG